MSAATMHHLAGLHAPRARSRCTIPAGVFNHTDCPIEELSEKIIREYVAFLLDQRKLNPNSINA